MTQNQKNFRKPKKLYSFDVFGAFSWIFLILSAWVIFGWFSEANFCFFDFWGSKSQKLKIFKNAIFLGLNRQIFHILWNFSVFEFLTPQKSKKRKLALENQPKMTQRLKIKKIHEKVQKAPQPYNFFGLMNFFLVLGHSCLKW